MFTGRNGWSVRNPCIICNAEDGTIDTLDGPVCPGCLPEELLPRASTLKKYEIVTYRRAHRDCRMCTNATCQQEYFPAASSDRSMGITSADSVVLADELNARISESNHADMVISFIKMAGLNLLIDSLRDMTEHGGKLRVITTAYMGNTEIDAVMALSALKNTEVRMELNADLSRLHAKSMIFRSETKSTAYVGSANISKSALTTGEEWVVKIRGEDLPEVIDDLERGFEHLWGMYGLTKADRSNRSVIERALERRGKSR